MKEHIIDLSWVEFVRHENTTLRCKGCIGEGNGLLCYYLPYSCSKALGGEYGVYKWKTYIDPCPLERNGRSRKVSKIKGNWYERILSESKSCESCDIFEIMQGCNCAKFTQCVDMVNNTLIDYHWKAI